jgi:hypothetical protein
VPDNPELKRDFKQSNFILYGLDVIPISISFGYSRGRRLLEFGLQSDKIMKSVTITSLKPTGLQNTHVLNSTGEMSLVNLYGLFIRGSYCVFDSSKDPSRKKGYTKLYLFAGLDILSPLREYTERGLFNIGYTTVNNDTVNIVPTETYYSRMAPRIHLGLTCSVFGKSGRHLFNIKTYWGTNSFVTLADFIVEYDVNGTAFHKDYAKMSISGWYFVLSKDVWFGRKKK